jgi:hypothetical protein
MINRSIHKAVEKAIIAGIHKNGHDIFYRSQNTLGCY